MLVHVLSVSSLKGGVGKTTVTLGLASAAFARGLRVLVVDLDPQADASTAMRADIDGHGSIADVLASPKEKVVRHAIAGSGWTKHHPGTVDVLIGSPAATNFDGPNPTVRDIWKLEEALALVEADYDLVLVDTAPSLNALTRTAWVASDRVALVTEPALFAVAAADRALRAIEEIRRGLSPRLQPLGIVVNRFRPKSAEHEFRTQEMTEMFGPLVLMPWLPERSALQQAEGAATPVHLWPGDSAAELAALFDQLLDRVVGAAQVGSNPIPAETAETVPPSEAAAPEAATTVEPAPESEPADTAPSADDEQSEGPAPSAEPSGSRTASKRRRSAKRGKGDKGGKRAQSADGDE